ncbi:nucleophile aminohydrolase [Aspergillus pseudodeflectus]|uniref:Nucleophile aminohydrolase n=1 Tax=Aspergillus pseudodeflectus TaxID=176178 RepID=A0ABR4LAZ2_9EURO
MPSEPLFKPTLIIHGGAGAIHRSALPPDLYARYHASLLSYLRSTKHFLENGATALDAAVHAVSLMEDDELFNCGRGSVFTSAGTIEMEASVMVTSVVPSRDVTNESAGLKRGAGVIGIKNVRHPIRLARELLRRTGQDANGNPVDTDGGGGSMHSQLAGLYVEDLAREWGLEFKPDEWFWTKQRWEEHRRGLGKDKIDSHSASEADGGHTFPSQGTVGCVCLDQWGDLAVATSTGGLTNKFPGRVGDTPTLGAGFWAEAWDVDIGDAISPPSLGLVRGMRYVPPKGRIAMPPTGSKSVWDMTLADCLPGPLSFLRATFEPSDIESNTSLLSHQLYNDQKPSLSRRKRRAVAVSGTGNGDSFLRTAAARTACAMARFSGDTVGLADAVSAVAGADGELQRSAGRRWNKTSEGMGGIIGIEAEFDDEDTASSSVLRRGKVVFDFNCGGMYRAYIEDVDGEEIERVMVFKEPYSSDI